MIQLTHLHTYAGPNIYATEPVVVVRVAWAGTETAASRGRFEAMGRKFPRWLSSVPTDEPVGSLDIGTGLALFAKWLLNDVRGFVRTAKCLAVGAERLFVLGYHDPQVTLRALQIGVFAFEQIDGNAEPELERRIGEFAQVCRRSHPDYQARILMQAAFGRNVPVLPFVSGSRIWQFGWGSRSRAFMESLSNADGNIGSQLAANKTRSKAFFKSLGIPTPADALVSKADELDEAVRRIGYPCVIKPLDRGGGKGVTANIVNPVQLVRAFESARQFSAGPLMLEQFIRGEDYRLMVVGGEFVAAIHRQPSFVIGDGSRTVRELVEQVNGSRSVDLLSSRYLRQVPFDAVLSAHLASQGWGLDDVLPERTRITLRSNANLSTGGVCADVTARVHRSVKEMAVQIVVSAGLTTAGVDYITTDISMSPSESGGAFIEMNTTPGLDAVLAAGWTPEAIGNIVLGTQVGRIPVELHLTQGRSGHGSTDAFDHPVDPSLAIVSEGEVRVGRALYRLPEARPWGAVAAALRNSCVESLEIHCALTDVVAHGMPVDRVDKVVIHGVSVPAPWMRVLQDHSEEIVVADC